MPTLARPLSLDEWRERTAIHAAYHDALTRALARARERFGFAILLDGHSMPSRGRLGHKDPGRTRAEVVPGDRDGTSCAPALTAHVTRHFERAGLTVAANDPYKGGFITTHHGRPADGIHAIQIELRRDLYMNEDASPRSSPASASSARPWTPSSRHCARFASDTGPLASPRAGTSALVRASSPLPRGEGSGEAEGARRGTGLR